MADPVTMPPGTRPSGGGFQQKIAGLPVWGWTALAAAAGIGFFLWRRGGAPAADTASQTPPVGFTAPTDSAAEFMSDEERYQTLLAQIRDLQGAVSQSQQPTTPPPTTPPPATTPSGVAAVPIDGLPAAGSGRGYGWVKMLPGDTTIAKAVDRANKVMPNGGFTTALYVLYNGPMNPVPGKFIKARGRSNPVMGPYFGK